MIMYTLAIFPLLFSVLTSSNTTVPSGNFDILVATSFPCNMDIQAYSSFICLAVAYLEFCLKNFKLLLKITLYNIETLLLYSQDVPDTGIKLQVRKFIHFNIFIKQNTARKSKTPMLQ